jgi:hypothetical protein
MITGIFHFVDLPVHDPDIGLMLVFQDVSPIYLKVNFQQWCEIGLAEIGLSRPHEIEAIKHVKTEFLGLIDAVHFIATTYSEDITDEDMRKSIRTYIDNYYKKGAKKEEILPATDFCQAFFLGISFDSAKSLLWVLMELVAGHNTEHEYHMAQSGILELFERYAAILIAGDDWKQIIKKYHQSNNTPGLKNKKGRSI